MAGQRNNPAKRRSLTHDNCPYRSPESEEKKMAKYRKKPVVIEATQWHKNGDHPNDDCETFSDSTSSSPFQGEGKIVRYWRTPDMDGQTPCTVCSIIMHKHGWIDTLEDGHRVCPGDWIITGVQGEFYPCKPDIFEATYDPA